MSGRGAFVGRTHLAKAFFPILAALVLAILGLVPPPVAASHILCSDLLEVTSDVTLDGDLDCFDDLFVISTDGITFDCRGHAINGASILLDQTRDVTVQNCVLFQGGFSIFGTALKGAHNNTLENNWAQGSVFLVHGNSTHNVLRDNVQTPPGGPFPCTGGYVLGGEAVRHNLLEGNIGACPGGSTFVLGAAQSNVLRNNSAIASFRGFFLAFAHNSHLANNTVVGTDVGYFVLRSLNATLAGNTAQSARSAGFAIVQSKFIDLRGNVATFGRTGFQLTVTSMNELAGNTALRTSSGFRLLMADDNLLVGNKAELTSVAFNLTQSNGNVLRANRAIQTIGGVTTFHLLDSRENVVQENLILRSLNVHTTTGGARGIWVDGDSSDNLIDRNHIIVTAQEGIFLGSNTADNFVRRNVLKDTGGLVDEGDNTLIGNKEIQLTKSSRANRPHE